MAPIKGQIYLGKQDEIANSGLCNYQLLSFCAAWPIILQNYYTDYMF